MVEWLQTSTKQLWCIFLLHSKAPKAKADKQKLEDSATELRKQSICKTLDMNLTAPAYGSAAEASKASVRASLRTQHQLACAARVKQAGKAKGARTTLPESDGGKEGERWRRPTVGRCTTETVLGERNVIHRTNYSGWWVN